MTAAATPTAPRTPSRRAAPEAGPAGVPLAVYVLGLGAFCMGMSEFMTSGLLPDISRDLQVSIPQVGNLMSAFAIGMVIGAPLIAALSMRLPRRTTLLVALGVFLAMHVVGALAPGYGMLLATRVVAAVACGTFWAVGTLVAVDLVSPGNRGKAMAVMVGGLTLANVVGVPLGTFVGDTFGWRATFWMVAILVFISFVGVVRLVPLVPAPAARVQLRREAAALRRPAVVVGLALMAVSQAALFGAFSYIAPLLRTLASVSPAAVPAVLVLFGVGSVIGIALGGRIADHHPLKNIAGGVAAQAALLLLIVLFARETWVVVVAVFFWGMAAFSVSPALSVRVLAAAHDAPTLAAATSVSAFNVGNALGPWLGGLTIGAGMGFTSPTVVGALLSLACLPLVLLGWSIDRRARHADALELYLAPPSVTPSREAVAVRG